MLCIVGTRLACQVKNSALITTEGSTISSTVGCVKSPLTLRPEGEEFMEPRSPGYSNTVTLLRSYDLDMGYIKNRGQQGDRLGGKNSLLIRTTINNASTLKDWSLPNRREEFSESSCSNIVTIQIACLINSPDHGIAKETLHFILTHISSCYMSLRIIFHDTYYFTCSTYLLSIISLPRSFFRLMWLWIIYESWSRVRNMILITFWQFFPFHNYWL